MKSYRIILAAAALLALGSCSQKASIDFTSVEAPDSEFVVKLLDVNVYTVLDTVKTNSKGHFNYSVKMEEGQPQFIYVFKGNTSVASLLLEAGEKAVVAADTLGNYTVEGSEGSAKLQQAEGAYSTFIHRVAQIVDALDAPSITEAESASLTAELSKLYVAHYRECLRFVMENPTSLSVIPVLYEKLSEYTPVFSHPTDAIRFQSAYESLNAQYPESKYVKALGKEATRRMNELEMMGKIETAESLNYIDIKMPDVKGQTRSLSEIDAKVVMVHFWTSADATQKMLNLDEIKPVYTEFHSKGFEIYSVCVDPDKATWAASVKNQGLEWINVNDGLGTSSPVLNLYNVTELPTTYLLVNGSFYTGQIGGVQGLKSILRRELK